jgi:hypothetical protein
MNIYSLLWKTVHENVTKTRSSLQIDATAVLIDCILKAYDRRSLREMFRCWSNHMAPIPNPKAIDIGSRCPFHWNHVICKINTLIATNQSVDFSPASANEPHFLDKIYLWEPHPFTSFCLIPRSCPCRVLDLTHTMSLNVNRLSKLKYSPLILPSPRAHCPSYFSTGATSVILPNISTSIREPQHKVFTTGPPPLSDIDSLGAKSSEAS